MTKIRDSTLNAQKTRADLKKTRDNVMANRVKAAKARVRARLGLPEEVEEEQKGEFLEENSLPIFISVHRIDRLLVSFFTDENLYDATDKTKEKQEAAAKKKAEIEKAKERERKKYVRPWDKSKLSSKHRSSSSSSESDEEKEWKPQSERHVMTQEEWNEKQRKERKQEFAPMNFVKSKEVFNMNNDFEEPNKTLFFSSSKKFKRRNQEVETKTQEMPRTGGAAIPPPPTFEYFGPSTSKQKRPSLNTNPNLEASISAGLKFLREQVDKGNKHKFTAASDYTETS